MANPKEADFFVVRSPGSRRTVYIRCDAVRAIEESGNPNRGEQPSCTVHLDGDLAFTSNEQAADVFDKLVDAPIGGD